VTSLVSHPLMFRSLESGRSGWIVVCGVMVHGIVES
jgi:hypothetical protein